MLKKHIFFKLNHRVSQMIKIKQTVKNMGLINYPLIDMFMYEIDKPHRISYFGDALFDKYSLVIDSDMSSEQEINEFIKESSSGYEDVFLFILPKNGLASNPIWNHLQNILTGFKNGQDAELFSQHPILIATKEFENFVIVGLVDNQSYIGETIEHEYEDSLFLAISQSQNPNLRQQLLGNTGVETIGVSNNEESSGSNYFYYFESEYPEVWEYLKEIGFLDDDCR